jgi:hypothetical protein
MPEAVFTHTRIPSITAMPTNLQRPLPTHISARNGASSQDASLREACGSATAALHAIAAVADSVADLKPDDPAHEAACRIVKRLQPKWQDDLRQAARIPAAGAGALRDKAHLLTALIEFQSDEVDDKHPLASLAASLAADVLHHTAQFPT